MSQKLCKKCLCIWLNYNNYSEQDICPECLTNHFEEPKKDFDFGFPDFEKKRE